MTGRPGGPVAVVGGADSPTGLTVARALARHGVHTVGLAVDPDAPPCRSRSWQEVLRVPGPDPAQWLEQLEKVHGTFGRTVLIPADDAVVRILAEHRAHVDGLADLVLPQLATVETLLDKSAFHPWAVRHGFPVPATRVVDAPAELRSALADLRFPVVLKPYERTAAWQEVSRRDKVRRLSAPADLDRLGFAPFDVADRFVVQEWIPGRDSDVWFCLTYRDRAGHEAGTVVGRKLLRWPVDTGSSALAVTAPDEELRALTTALFDAAGLVGLGSLEVRRDRRDGRMLITEPTVGRPNLQSGLATAAGVELVHAAYCDAAGAAARPLAQPRPAVWIHESNLPRSVAVSAARRTLDVGAVAGALCAALSGRRRAAAAFAARGDARPLAAELRRLGRKSWRAAMRRARSRERAR